MHDETPAPSDDDVLAAVGPRLRRLRTRRDRTLASLSAETGISASTLSRLESGGRRATLELLLPIARALKVPLDELVGAPEDPRVHGRPMRRDGMIIQPLSRDAGTLQAFKHTLPGGPVPEPDQQRTHEGFEWLYILSGRLRLLLGEHDLVLPAGEAAEFDTRVPHWFGRADAQPVEFLSLFGRQGERMHVRASTRR
ncbi:helix-turn-helix domain-containing protein [Rathayibacter iranicus]|uniref:Helix-turn-helix domain-containing protein n=2 Tax=Rathayibacter iranicus TaxID=59737 RepID=A0AAD1ADN5_9MICO|nr:helix-turn-helix domain-containing protein [Rathayibacter iranicus]AZZ56209.1 helix-turn-helix domain-containing protein [Rathayibacter iranicus]MWV30086.1 helix-turn-helix domain-containing protein [Rathayibacter iranicus NCPPB 2253 = VKM Ac-1602]PPI46276.1 XRE family transcriptional regulator [Rathayibacter iranicus]PPI59651.1 XRE family transcriptional regulator [Rathayibacter iranicus]PPI71128.1 XRE family transcriptional regulator [Rathayibacter iranicus]